MFSSNWVNKQPNYKCGSMSKSVKWCSPEQKFSTSYIHILELWRIAQWKHRPSENILIKKAIFIRNGIKSKIANIIYCPCKSMVWLHTSRRTLKTRKGAKVINVNRITKIIKKWNTFLMRQSYWGLFAWGKQLEVGGHDWDFWELNHAWSGDWC